MHIERLKHLTTVLKEVPPERFDLWGWDCGTAACAVGWACRDPQMQDEGLRMFNGIPHYKGLSAWPAVEAFFDLPEYEAAQLFMASRYKQDPATPQDVIARIEKLLEEAGHDA
jgi:hypothetical protein